MGHDGRLLREYLEHGDQAAFARLVGRYLGLVYSACLRETGAASQAEDAAQAVFLLMAHKAPSLTARASLAGWLFAAARLVSRNARRQERRRQGREQRAMEEMTRTGRDAEADAAAWDRVAPALNDALAALNGRDREAVLLRFFQGLSLAETGAALGVSEDAAKMRVSRAVDKLRRHLAKGGGTVVSCAALAALLPIHAAHSLPAGGAAKVVAALSLSTPGTIGVVGANVYGLCQGAEKAMWMTKMKIAAVLVSVGLLGGYGGVAATRAFSAARHRPTATRQSTPVQAGVKKGSASAGPLMGQLQALQLPEEFTLTYRQVTRDMTTPEMRAKRKEDMRQEFDPLVRQGQMDQKSEDQTLSALLKADQQPPIEAKVVLSAHGGKLLLWRRGVSRTDQDTSVTLYDGVNTFCYDLNNGRAEVRPGIWLLTYFPAYPLPGVGLPGLPLMKPDASQAATPGVWEVAGQALRRQHTEPVVVPQYAYFPGKIQATTQGGRIMVLNASSSSDGHPFSRWEYMQHQLFAGHWIASRMRWTGYIGGQPATVCDFTLQEAKTTPLSAKQFGGEYWLLPNTWVGNTIPNGHSFGFDPSRGSLDDQIRNAQNRQ